MVPRKVDTMQEALEKVDTYVKRNKVFIFSKSWCPFCNNVKALFDKLKVKYSTVEVDHMSDDQQKLWKQALRKRTGMQTFPNVFIRQTNVGGHDDIFRAHKEKRLDTLLNRK